MVPVSIVAQRHLNFPLSTLHFQLILKNLSTAPVDKILRTKCLYRRERCPQRSDRRRRQFGIGSVNLPIEVKFSDGTPGTAFPPLGVRISYAEREPATSRVGPMVLFNHQTIRTNWLRALPGVPYRSNSIRRAEASDRSGGFCSPFGSHNPSVTSLSPGTAGRVHKKFSILFVQSVLYYHQRAPGMG